MTWYDLQIGEDRIKYKIMVVSTEDKSIKCDNEGRAIKRETTDKAKYKNIYADTKQEYIGKVYFKRGNEISETPFVFERTTSISSSEIEDLPLDFEKNLLTEKHLYFDAETIRERLDKHKVCFGFPMVLRESEVSYYCVLKSVNGHLIGYLGRNLMDSAIKSIMENKPLKEMSAKTYIKPNSLLKENFKVVIAKQTTPKKAEVIIKQRT